MSFVTTAPRRTIPSNEASKGSVFLSARRSSTSVVSGPNARSVSYNATPQRPMRPINIIQNNWNGSSRTLPQLNYVATSNFQQPNTTTTIIQQNKTTNSTNGYVISSGNYNGVSSYPQQTRLADVRYCDTSYYDNESANNEQSHLVQHAADG